MTVVPARCRRAFDVDLVAFVHDARGPQWAEFREHYPLCAECSVEVRTWTELEIVLQGGGPPGMAHPTPEDLLHLDGGGNPLDPDYRRLVEYHIASCRPCADEIATLRTFDFTGLGMGAAHFASPSPEDLAAPIDTTILPVAEVPAGADACSDEVESVVSANVPANVPADADEACLAASADPTDAEVGEPEEDLPPDTESRDESEPLDTEEESDGSADPSCVVPADRGFLPPEALVEGYAALGEEPDVGPGFAQRVIRVVRHPAVGLSLVAALLLPVLWVGELPRFPFGNPAGRVSYEFPEARVAVAIVDEARHDTLPAELRAEDLVGGLSMALEFPSALRGIEAEELPPPAASAEIQVVLASDVGTSLEGAPGIMVPDEVAGSDEAVELWSLTRLDDTSPVEIIATELVAGVELEVPVPLTVPTGAVLQVQIKDEGTREIVERMAFPGVREVALRVPAAWLVPGTYQVDVGVVRRGPAPVQVATYALIVY